MDGHLDTRRPGTRAELLSLALHPGLKRRPSVAREGVAVESQHERFALEYVPWLQYPMTWKQRHVGIICLIATPWRVGVCCVGHGLRKCSTIIPPKLDSGSETLRKRRGLTARLEHSDDPVHLRLAGKKPFHRHLHPLEFEFSGQVIQAADCVASHLLANVGSAQLLPTEARELCPPLRLSLCLRSHI